MRHSRAVLADRHTLVRAGRFCDRRTTRRLDALLTEAAAVARDCFHDNGPTQRPVWSAGRPLYRVPEAMAFLSVSRTVLYELIRSGRLRSVKQGRRRLIPASAIASYVALLEAESDRRAA